MAATDKPIKINYTVEVYSAAGSQRELIKTIKDTAYAAPQVNAVLPNLIPASSVDVQVPFGMITQAKRIILTVDREVTVKVNDALSAGFPFGPGTLVLPSDTGISALFLTAGPNQTSYEAIVAGV